MRRLGLAGLILVPALLVSSAQAGAAHTQTNVVKKTAKPVWQLAMDGARVAYASGGRVHVWDLATGATSVVAGKYGNAKGTEDASQLAISGRRVWSDSRSVSIYSTAGDLLQHVALDPPDGNTTGTEIAISGNLLVALTTRIFEPNGPTTVTLQIYDWTTGELLNTWLLSASTTTAARSPSRSIDISPQCRARRGCTWSTSTPART
jgi:hypothetical protein